MYDALLVTQPLSIFWALFAVVLVVLVSRWLDLRAGVSFKDVIAEIRQDPRAAAAYYGRRFLGICIVVGAALY